QQNVIMLGDARDFVVGTVTKQPKATNLASESSADEASKEDSDDATAADAQPVAAGEDAREAELKSRQAALQELDRLWALRDQLVAAPVHAISVDQWRTFDELLLAAERRLRIGLFDAAEKLLADRKSTRLN